MSGTLVIIAAPSGGGKTTVINELVRVIPNTVRFVTSTTRPARSGEVNGIDYHFLTRSEFAYKIVQGDFVEYVTYADHYYGTDRTLLNRLLEKYTIVFAPIDVRGKESYENLPFDQVSIFLKPESLDVLAARLARRAGITQTEIDRRLAVAKEEIGEAATFDYCIENKEGQLNSTLHAVRSVLDKISQKG
jgi:guanylate kinase